jgi:hypothetical protein
VNKLEDLTIDLYPSDTGLPMAISLSHGWLPAKVCIKVMQVHNRLIDPGKLAVVALYPQPRVVDGQLSPADLQLVEQWLALNAEAVLEYWNPAIIGIDALRPQLQRLVPP